VFIPLVSFGQKPISDKFQFNYEQEGGAYGDNNRPYAMPSFAALKGLILKNIKTLFFDDGMQNRYNNRKGWFTEENRRNAFFYRDGSISYFGEPPNAFFYYDNNVFRDNDMVTIIQSSYQEADFSACRSSGYYKSNCYNYFSFVFKKSDLSPLKFKFDNSAYKHSFNKNISLEDKVDIKFIFNDDPETLIIMKGLNYFKEFTEIDEKDELILSLKKYSYVDIMLKSVKQKQNEYRGKYKVETEAFYRVSLKGTTKALNKIIKGAPTSKKNEFEYIYNMGLANMNPFDYEAYIYKFLEDAKKNHNLNFDYTKNTILTISKRLEDNIIAVALASNDDNKVVIAIDPESWQKASQPKRWYIIYHELGHDILNLDHGECGAMMNAYAKPDYSWLEFEKDKSTMFESYKRLKQN